MIRNRTIVNWMFGKSVRLPFSTRYVARSVCKELLQHLGKKPVEKAFGFLTNDGVYAVKYDERFTRPTTMTLCIGPAESLVNKDSKFLSVRDMIYENREKLFKKPLRTEDTGKIFEMAICMALETPYNGVYKYDLDEPRKISQKLSFLKGLDFVHTAEKGSPYDFTSLIDPAKHLSAKSTKKGIGKVAPQVVGQCTPEKFSQLMEFTGNIRQDIQENVHRVLELLEKHTFDCPILYYHKAKDTVTYVEPIKFDWTKHQYTWTRDWQNWKNSTTLKADGVPILEIQIHSKKRKNMAFRWYFENVIQHRTSTQQPLDLHCTQTI